MGRIYLAAVGVLAALLAVASLAWACGPADGPPTVNPSSGPPGSKATVTLYTGAGPLEIRWDDVDNGTLLATATASGWGPTSVPITIPADASDGWHTVVAINKGPSPPTVSRVAFRVIGPPAPRPPSPGDPGQPLAAPPALIAPEGPSISSEALREENGTRAVTRSGSFSLFCGRFSEVGVTGSCGAEGVAARASRLKVGPRRFAARPGQPVRVKFRLSRSSLKLLKAAGKLRMRGTVVAQDAFGNASTATFGFSLKAPVRR